MVIEKMDIKTIAATAIKTTNIIGLSEIFDFIESVKKAIIERIDVKVPSIIDVIFNIRLL